MRALSRPAALLLALAPALALAFTVPPAPQRFLYDGASVLNGSERQRIEDRLMQLNRQGQQIGVCVLPSLDGESVEDATMRIAETWRPGFRTRDNGVVIGVFINDRKMRIEVGYGLESRIPDSVARSIVMDRMRPAFRRGDYAGGIMSAIDAVAGAALGGNYRSSGQTTFIPGGYHFDSDQLSTGSWGGFSCCCWLLFAFFILRAILRGIFRPRFYGFGSQAVYRPNVPWWGWFLFGNAMKPSGYRHHHRSGWFDNDGWGGGGGGGWSGGGGGGSFGGGSFGGGGASGSW